MIEDEIRDVWRLFYHCGWEVYHTYNAGKIENGCVPTIMRSWVWCCIHPFVLNGEDKEELSGTDDLRDRGGALGIWNLREKKFSKIIQWDRCWGNLYVWTKKNKLRNDRIWLKSILSRGFRSSVRRALWEAHLGGKVRSSRDRNFRDCFMRVVWSMLICWSNNFKK